MSREVSKKLSYLYFLMTAMVIGLHSVSVNSLGFFGISKDFNSYVRVFYDAATGSFFFFSAFLLFRKEHKYTELLKRKIYSLLIPYLIFNIIAFLYKDVLRELVLYHSLSQYDVKELFYKILLSTANPPLWFMRVLIEFVIIYPIIRMILNNEILAGGGIILTVILHLLIGVNVGYSTVQYWMPLYLMGATFGKNYENQFCISKKIKTLISVIVFFILIFLAKESDVIFYFYRLVSPILMWYIFDFFKKFPSPRWWIKCTVFYYGMHILVISPVAKTYKLFLGQNIIALFLAHIIVPAICITLLAVIAMIVRKFIPEIWKIMIGGRS